MRHTLPAYATQTRIQARIHVVELRYSLSQLKEQITSKKIADSALKSLAIVQEYWENVIRNAIKVGWGCLRRFYPDDFLVVICANIRGKSKARMTLNNDMQMYNIMNTTPCKRTQS